jgi:hypothetical protein
MVREDDIGSGFVRQDIMPNAAPPPGAMNIAAAKI